MSRARHANDDALAPAFVAALQRGTHHVHIANALEAELHAAVGEFDDDVLNRLVMVFGVDAIGCAHQLGQTKLARVGVNADDASGLGLPRPLDHGQTNAA